MSRNTEILSELMDEFGLQQAKLRGEDWTVELSYQAPSQKVRQSSMSGTDQAEEEQIEAAPIEAAPRGTPIASPMTGIYYESPSPGSPPFVTEGSDVRAGQVIGLIEAMKVFEEITSNISGTVIEVRVKNGDLVQSGETLMVVE